MLGFDPLEVVLNDVESFLPFDLAEAFTIAQQRLHQAVIGVNMSPGKLALDTG